MKFCNKATMGSTGGGINSRVPHSQLPYPKNLISDIIGKYCDMELSAEQIGKLETAVSELPFGEQNAIRYRYKYRFTPRQAGKKIGMSESRVLGYQKKALLILRKPENLVLYCPDGESVQNASRIIRNTEPVRDAASAGKPIQECGLSVRLTNCLLRQSIFTLGELLACTWQHLRTFHGFGNVSEGELREYLTAQGLYLLDL